jgi:hypothetical protein
MNPFAEAWANNPFYVLGVPTTATALEIEREMQKLLGLLNLDVESAKTYATPFGPRPRDAEKVREAARALRDAKQRLFHEVLASLPANAVVPAPAPRFQVANATKLIGLDLPDA